MKPLIFLWIILQSSFAIHYDSYHGTPISNDELKRHDVENNTSWCVVNIRPCDPNEGKRVDGSCNSLQQPTVGGPRTRPIRMLPANFSFENLRYEPRKAESGHRLPQVRSLRTKTLAEGHVPSKNHTHLLTHFWLFATSDFISAKDTPNFVSWRPYCCEEKGKTDPVCTPIKVPDDDPVLRFSNIRCLNLTRPLTFQYYGCLPNNTIPERIISGTTLLDLSNIYGTDDKKLLMSRTLKGGLLKYENEDGTTWPPSFKESNDICSQNKPPAEIRCHKTPDKGTNSHLGVNLFSIWYWRNHNLIAKELAEVNPCWSDQKLFDTARDINIASHSQILYYEAMPALMGRENLIQDGIITQSEGFRDMYDPNEAPFMTMEYPYALRWMHTMQEGRVKMFDSNGYYLKEMPLVNISSRTGYLAIDKNLAKVTQGSFRQYCAAPDHVVDPDMAELGLGATQKVLDVASNDLAKGRYFGFQPYIKYRELCYGNKIQRWADFLNFMDHERMDILSENYGHINDVDLMAGMWSERHLPGSSCPATFYCLLKDQYSRMIKSDRHWYERPNRPNAFTLPQLLEIRKRTVSSLLCDVGDSVSKIQPSSFNRIGAGNKLTFCNKINKIDYTKWSDPSCQYRKA